MIGRLRSAGVRIGVVLAGSMMGVVWPGCGTGDFVTPPPPELRDSLGGGSRGSTAGSATQTPDPFAPGSTVRSIEMIAGRWQDPDQAETERSAARSQAGVERARIRILPDEDPAASEKSAGRAKSQAQLVREATARKPQALIVEPDDPSDADLARAVQEARAAKVPVVLLGRPLAGAKGPGAAPLILVAPQSFADSARQLVALSMRNAGNAKLDPEGGAILLITSPGDPFLPDRVAAVREALEAAKVSPVDEIRIPKDTEAGARRLTQRLEADARLAMVFAFDFIAASASNQVAGLIVEKRPFIQAGYTSDDNLPRMALAGEFAALADYVPTRLVKKAVSTAAQVAQGRDLPDRVEVGITVRVSPEHTGAPRLQARNNALRKEAEKKP
jgi:ABC-type sugar transport system substrate-binding protein